MGPRSPTDRVASGRCGFQHLNERFDRVVTGVVLVPLHLSRVHLFTRKAFFENPRLQLGRALDEAACLLVRLVEEKHGRGRRAPVPGRV
jgi:hypothetical protein